MDMLDNLMLRLLLPAALASGACLPTGSDDDDAIGDDDDSTPSICADASPCAGDFELALADEFEALANCRTLDGSISIGGDDFIDSLELPCLVALDDLLIEGASSLESLVLPSLERVGGRMCIEGVPQLSSLDGLGALVEVGGGFDIKDTGLLSLDGLSSLESVGGNLSLERNPVLSDASGLSSLVEVDGYLRFLQTGQLTSFSGSSNLTQLDGVLFNGNEALLSITGFTNVSELGDIGLHLRDNPQLQSVDAFGSLEVVGDDVSIQGNASLSDLNALSALNAIGDDLDILDNSSLTDVSGLALLESVGGSLTVEGNSQLCAASAADIFDAIDVQGTREVRYGDSCD